MEVSKEHHLLGHLKMIYFPFKKKKRWGWKGQMLCPRVFSGKRRTNERTGIKSCNKGELVSLCYRGGVWERCWFGLK